MTDMSAAIPISLSRFNAFAGYARSPDAAALGTELSWFEFREGRVLATLIKDTDREYSAALLAPDLAERYRWVGQTAFFKDAEDAQIALIEKASDIINNLETRREQGDEGTPVDFFAPVKSKSKPHSTFLQLRDGAGWQAARAVINLQMRWYENQDGNFVEQFQTTGFDARIWELYLFATFIESGYHVEQPSPAPDFKFSGARGTLHLEATTVNPSIVGGRLAPTPSPTGPTEIQDYFANYLPIRFAGPLVAKLHKSYWTKPNWQPIPFVIAIQDFHAPMSMTFSGDGLLRYLYGIGEMGIDSKPLRVTTHKWGPKEVESNFFSLPGSEHIAAVMYNSSGTLPKFNRIGTAIGLGAPTVHLRHEGSEYTAKDQTWQNFDREVTEGYSEEWVDGSVIYHNPNALHPLDPEMIPGAAHYWWKDDDLIGMIPDGHLLRSGTAILTATSDAPTEH